jgi:hypothetical protein
MIRPTFMFVNLRHLTCEITIFTDSPNMHTGIIQLAHCLDRAPQLETLKLHVSTLLLLFVFSFFVDEH